MSLDGKKISDADTFTVVTNSFLANGGDGFTPFAQGTARTDTGQVDLDATLAYAAAVKPMAPRRSDALCWSPPPRRRPDPTPTVRPARRRAP
jgi:5'-nucleotidase